MVRDWLQVRQQTTDRGMEESGQRANRLVDDGGDGDGDVDSSLDEWEGSYSLHTNCLRSFYSVICCSRRFDVDVFALT